MLLLSQLPQALSSTGKPPTAEMSETSLITLQGLQRQYANTDLKGIVADFGSGNGTQAIALLMLHPKKGGSGIEKAYGLEVDPERNV